MSDSLPVLYLTFNFSSHSCTHPSIPRSLSLFYQLSLPPYLGGSQPHTITSDCLTPSHPVKIILPHKHQFYRRNSLDLIEGNRGAGVAWAIFFGARGGGWGNVFFGASGRGRILRRQRVLARFWPVLASRHKRKGIELLRVGRG